MSRDIRTPTLTVVRGLRGGLEVHLDPPAHESAGPLVAYLIRESHTWLRDRERDPSDPHEMYKCLTYLFITAAWGGALEVYTHGCYAPPDWQDRLQTGIDVTRTRLEAMLKASQ